MYDARIDEPAKANTSDLNEDLGQIEYLFSDKTGTLTENEMELKQLSVDGVVYYEKDNKLYVKDTNQLVDINEVIALSNSLSVANRSILLENLQNKSIRRVLVFMCLCHTVQVDGKEPRNYQASSPDELSFVKFCQK